ncbi:MAG: hypothetical protein K8W52_31815 [Deltaproteobacteria bacterium]|nr:hypothetical protein [Deltaproteobacteria bacterium]
MAYDPGLGIGVGEALAPVAVLIVGVAFVWLVTSQAKGDMVLFGVAGAVICVGALAFLLYRIAAIATAPLVREVAVVVGRRTHVSSHHHHLHDGHSGLGRHTHVTTTYFLTLEFGDGSRGEYETSGGQVGILTDGDIGIAYRRAGRLIDFRRFAV